MRLLLQIVAALACLCAPGLSFAGSEIAGAKCPSANAGRDFDGLLLCVPPGNERYILTEDGVDWMAWLGDEPVPFPDKDAPLTGNELDMTLARTWIGETAMGMSDKVAGKLGFDHFMRLMAASILQGAQLSAPSDEFAADVPTDESGMTQRFDFKLIDPDLLQGQSVGQNDTGVDFILFRPSSGETRPEILLCGKTNEQGPTHLCMNMLEIDGHRVGIVVTGTKLVRSFHIAERIGADLKSFAIDQAP